MNKYLEKIALRRIVKELVAGNLSQSAHSLARRGLIKRPGVYAKGMEKGNQELARKRNAVIRGPIGRVEGDLSEGSGAIARIGEDGVGHVVSHRNRTSEISKVTQGTPNRAALSTRHELHEIPDMRKQINSGHVLSKEREEILRNELLKSYGENDTNKFLTGFKKVKNILHGVMYDISPGSLPGKTHFLKERGRHASPRVLARESNDVRTNPFIKNFKDERKMTGESDILERITGKRYGVDKFTNRDYRKLESKVSSRIDSEVVYPSNISNYSGYLT